MVRTENGGMEKTLFKQSILDPMKVEAYGYAKRWQPILLLGVLKTLSSGFMMD